MTFCSWEIVIASMIESSVVAGLPIESPGSTPAPTFHIMCRTTFTILTSVHLFVVSTASGEDGVTASKKAVPPVPVRQQSVADNASSACIVSKKLNVQLFKGDIFSCCTKVKHFSQPYLVALRAVQ